MKNKPFRSIPTLVLAVLALIVAGCVASQANETIGVQTIHDPKTGVTTTNQNVAKTETRVEVDASKLPCVCR